MQIYVRWHFEILTIDGVESGDTVESVMAKIYDQIGLPVNKQRLFNQRGEQMLVLEGRTSTMADYGIVDGSSLRLSRWLGGGTYCQGCASSAAMWKELQEKHAAKEEEGSNSTGDHQKDV